MGNCTLFWSINNQNFNDMNEIKLITMPVIQHDLITVGKMVDERLLKLNLANLVATDETISTMKKLRAELNNELKEFEGQRKVVKEAILKPYSELDAIYKEEVAEKYKMATDILKDKIGEFENRIKDEKKQEVEDYFNEWVLNEGIQWFTFPMLKMDINLSTTTKKYKEEVAEVVQRVKSDLELIAIQSYEAEILVEYKKDLNISRAIKTVADRKEAERKEQQRLIDNEIEAREMILTRQCNMVRRDFEKHYVNILHDDIHVSYDFIRNSTKDEWNERVKSVLKQLNDLKQQAIKPTEALKAPEVVEPTPAAPTPTPVQEIDLITISFEVTGQYGQLRLLNQYLKQSGLNYKQLN